MKADVDPGVVCRLLFMAAPDGFPGRIHPVPVAGGAHGAGKSWHSLQECGAGPWQGLLREQPAAPDPAVGQPPQRRRRRQPVHPRCADTHACAPSMSASTPPACTGSRVPVRGSGHSYWQCATLTPIPAVAAPGNLQVKCVADAPGNPFLPMDIVALDHLRRVRPNNVNALGPAPGTGTAIRLRTSLDASDNPEPGMPCPVRWTVPHPGDGFPTASS